jgi:hypothetical protein
MARRLGLPVIGTLSVLDFAAAQGLVDLPIMFERLRQTTFRSPVRLMASMLEQDARRRNVQEAEPPFLGGRYRSQNSFPLKLRPSVHLGSRLFFVQIPLSGRDSLFVL